MNEFTFQKLEYGKIKEMLLHECSSSLGAKLVEELAPITDAEEIANWQQETTEGVTVRRLEPNIPLGGLHDVAMPLRKAEIGGMLEPAELVRILDTLYAAKRLNQFLVQRKKQYEIPRMEWWASQLTIMNELEQTIDSVVTPEGAVRDDASLKLLELRRKINTIRNRIKDKLDSLVKSESTQKYLQDSLVTIRGDRYVVPVKSEYRGQVPGIVHDQSASGATLFIEPMVVVELNNDLRKAYTAEREEINRILLELSGRVAQDVEILRTNQEVLARIDFIFAKARLSEKMQGVEPVLKTTPELDIRRGRHPLIPKDRVVPLSITLGQEFDSVIITGPNTGGKTVTLKTVGLFVLMTQSGLHVPAEVGTQMGLFHGVFADIGDEQSIEQSLSTFSSHMTNIVRILKQTNQRSLVLLDELGAGTDPSEGAALAIAILNHLLHQGGKIIATTHYSELKAYAFNEPRVQNASVEFDVETLRPTYRLLVGVPGKSNAFEIAHKLGIQSQIIQDARSLISQEEQDVADLIEALETSNIIAEKKREESEAKLREVEVQLAALEAERAKLEAKTEEIKRKAQEDALEIVREARKESEEILKELRTVRANTAKEIADAQDYKKMLSESEEKLAKAVNKGPVVTTNKVKKVKVGDEVYVPKFTQHGTVLALPDKQGNVQLQVGIMKVAVPLEELQQSAKKKETGKTVAHQMSVSKTETIKSEIDLRGMLVEEALEYVDKYLDDAYLSSLGQVNIIHGKGTGALRNAIRSMLRNHPHVKSSRLGGFSEGGDGVTIVELKK